MRVFSALQGRGRSDIAGQCEHNLASFQPVCQPEMKPETFGAGGPGILVRGLKADLRLSFSVTRDAGLDETRVEVLARTLVETFDATRD